MKAIPFEGITKPVSALIMGSDYFSPDHQEAA